MFRLIVKGDIFLLNVYFAMTILILILKSEPNKLSFIMAQR